MRESDIDKTQILYGYNVMKQPILIMAFAGLLLLSACGLRSRGTMDSELPLPTSTELERSAEPMPSVVAPALDGRYIVQFSDQLSVFFPAAAAENFDALVRPDGCITLPQIGDLMVAGLSAEEIGDRIADAYKPILRDPTAVVSLRSTSPQSLYVFGEVKRPNKYDFTPGMDLMAALSAAGGVERSAAMGNLLVLRVNSEGMYTYQVHDMNDLLSSDRPYPVMLQARDIVIVPTTTIADIGIWIDQYINTFLPPIDAYLRGRYYWKLANDVVN
jgi:protein involved in polysaccharide export with SLBB domain